MTAPPHEPMTLEEFLAWAPGEEQEYEFVDGRVVVMSNGSLRHDLLATAITTALAGALAPGPCPVLSVHHALRLGARVRRPDVLVACAGVTLDLAAIYDRVDQQAPDAG